MDAVELHERFISNVCRLLSDRGMTRSELAKAMGKHPAYVNVYLGTANGKTAAVSKPGIDVIAEFARVLSIDPAELLREPELALSA